MNKNNNEYNLQNVTERIDNILNYFDKINKKLDSSNYLKTLLKVRE